MVNSEKIYDVVIQKNKMKVGALVKGDNPCTETSEVGWFLNHTDSLSQDEGETRVVRVGISSGEPGVAFRLCILYYSREPAVVGHSLR